MRAAVAVIVQRRPQNIAGVTVAMQANLLGALQTKMACKALQKRTASYRKQSACCRRSWKLNPLLQLSRRQRQAWLHPLHQSGRRRRLST